MPRAAKLATAVVGLALALAHVTPAAAGGSGGVLVVGDSLAELTLPYLERYLPGVPLTVNAVGGYNSFQVYDLFEQSYEPSHSVVVFDGGTNDNPAYPEILAGNLAKVAARTGDRCMVVPTVHGYTVEGIGNEGKNSVVESFAASRLGTQTPDWAGAVVTRPDLLQPDGLHPTSAGADFRARLIARGVRSCLALGSARPEPARPAIAAAPELPPATRLAARQREVGEAIAAELAREVVARLARAQPLLATAMLTMVSSDA